MYDAFLIPTDGSEGTLEAVSQGIELARQTGAVVHALHVIDERFAMTEYDAVNDELEATAERALDEVASLGEAEGVTVERHLRRGIPHEEIIDAADDYGVDLIVMGTRGRTGFDRFVNLGSTTERVVRLADRPVLTAPLREGRD